MFAVNALRLAQTSQDQIAMYRKRIPEERLIGIKKRLDLLPPRSGEGKRVVKTFGELYGVSVNSVYRALREQGKPKGLRRSDVGKSRILPASEMEWYCQIIAAMKVRTLNKKDHHLSTAKAIRILEDAGIRTSRGLVQPHKGILKKTTVNRYLSAWGYDLRSLDVEPVATRFQAKHSNECWQLDLSPSDLKDLAVWPDWMDPRKGRPQRRFALRHKSLGRRFSKDTPLEFDQDLSGNVIGDRSTALQPVNVIRGTGFSSLVSRGT
jgi:hypothetical protein